MFSFKSDPLDEEKYTILPGLVHKYFDRILVELIPTKTKKGFFSY